MKKNSLSKWARAALLAGTLMLAAAGVVLTQTAGARETGKAKELKLQVDNPSGSRDMQMRSTFAPVVKEVAPSVVNVFPTTKSREVQVPGFGQNPLLRRFFGDDFEGPGRTFRTPQQTGVGSGVIVTEDGYILTNNHVVEGADEIKVAINPDGKIYDAKVVGRDPKSDIAVLKVEASGLKAIKLGNSDVVEVGDVVLAVGNPFGVGQTVTMGIVGATSREVFGRPMGLEYEDFIQTDAPINPGNSGGALIDSEGRLVGINTAIVSRGGGNNGIGFAVPINLARSVMENIVEHGKVIRGFLGVKIQAVTPAMASEFGLKESTGALVADVEVRSPAEKAGIKAGDVITEFDGKQVRDNRQLRFMVAQTAPNTEVKLTVLRDGKTKSLGAVVKELPDDREMAGMRRGGSRGSGPAEDTGGLQGVTVADLTPQLRRQYEIPADVDGALVAQVAEDSPAAEAGLHEGDVIREIKGKAVKSAEEAVDMAQGLANKRIRLRVWRDGGNLFLVVDESKTEAK